MSLSKVGPATGTDVRSLGVADLIDSASVTVHELLAACTPNDPLQSRLQFMQVTMARLATLTGQFEAAKPVSAAPVDLNAVAREMTAPLQRLLGPFISLETAFHSSGVWAAVDRSQIEQVALGLVVNAREALPLGGIVQMATRTWVVDQPTRYHAGTLPAGTWSALEVRNNGASVDEQGLRDLLEPSSRQGAFSSTLSLATVAAVIRKAGGHVVLDMPNDGGTVLIACLPAALPRRSRRTAPGTAEAILIVDDDEWARTSAAHTLRNAGYGVLEAGHAQDAVELLDDVAGSCVRLMIADRALLSGGPRPLGERVRRERPEVAVMVTGGGSMMIGGDGEVPVLTKPIRPEALLHAVGERLSLHR